MYVYLLHHATEPRFKIGKANDIYQRISGIGGVGEFNLPASLCVQLQSEGEAYRLEKILHRVFDPWNIRNDRERFPGDTEQFNVHCFERVVKFLTDNSDLFAGALPIPLPVMPSKPIEKNNYSLEERRQIRMERERQEQQLVDQKFDAAIMQIERGISRLLEMRLDVFEICALPYQFMVIESSKPELFEEALSIVGEWVSLCFSPKRRRNHWSSIVCSVTSIWDKEVGSGRIDAHISSPITDANRADFDNEFIRIVEMIPLSISCREPMKDDWEMWLARENTP